MRTSDSLDLIASLMEAPDVDELWRRIHLAAVGIGFDCALVGIEVQLPGMEPIQHVMSGWPEEYQLLYADRGYVLLDPTVAHCQTSTAPIIWAPEIYRRESLEVLEESRRFGLHHGLSVAVHGLSRAKSMLSLARHQYLDPDAHETRTALAGARVLATCAHMALEGLLVPKLVEQEYPVKLTARESQIMQYVASGKGSEVIGDLLGLSKATVEFHVKNMLRKLGVASRLQGVARAVALGLVH
jgi:DNA-binding CsgD family transcriptional regulator